LVSGSLWTRAGSTWPVAIGRMGSIWAPLLRMCGSTPNAATPGSAQLSSRTMPSMPSCVRCPEHLRQNVRLAAPRLLNDGLQEAQRAEAIFLSRATPQRGPSACPHVRGAGHELGDEDKDDGDVEPVRQVPSSVPQARQQPKRATSGLPLAVIAVMNPLTSPGTDRHPCPSLAPGRCRETCCRPHRPWWAALASQRALWADSCG